MANNEQYYKSGVLKPDIHARLVANMDSYAEQSRIPVGYICNSMRDVATDEELDWFRESRQLVEQGIVGLCYTGMKFKQQRMFYLGGAFLRNFIDVKVYTVKEFTDWYGDEGVPPLNTVVIIPDFFENGGGLPKWEVSKLNAAILGRFMRSLITVIHCDSMEDMSKVYGFNLSEHIHNHYRIIE